MTIPMTISLYDKMHIMIECDDYACIRQIREHFTDYATGFLFAPKYKSGMWDGKICLMNWTHKSLPYGLLLDLVRFVKTKLTEVELTLTADVTSTFKGTNTMPVYDLNIKPRPYQQDCIESSLKYGRGLIVSSTASGKSLIIAYIIKHLLDAGLSKKALIIVPTIQLVTQFYSDLGDYGMNNYTIGKVWAKSKEWDSQIVISTWQTLSKHHDMLQTFDCVITDEVHQAKAHEIKDILKHATRATFRLGFTGTLPVSKLDNWNIKSYLGPVIREYGPGQLSDLGFISKCNVNAHHIEYKHEYEGTYLDIQDAVFKNSFRLDLIANLIAESDGNVLVLVGKVEKEGKFLKEYLDGCDVLKDREVIFVWGATDKDDREFWRKEMERRKNIVLIATYQLFSTGTNIPSLKYLLLAAPYKSKIRTLQSVGRTLRLHADKTDGAYVYDIIDETKHFSEFGTKRLRYYASESFTVNEFEHKEGD